MCLYQLKGDELKLYDSQSEEIIRPVKAKAFIFMLLSLQGVLITIREYPFSRDALFLFFSKLCNELLFGYDRNIQFMRFLIL